MAEKNKKLSKKYQADRDAQPVKGIFHFLDKPGQVLKFDYVKWGNEKQTHWELTDGEVCTVTRGVARHLNNSGRRLEYVWEKNPDGSSKKRRITGRKRYWFENLEFFELDEAGLQNEIITEPTAAMVG